MIWGYPYFRKPHKPPYLMNRTLYQVISYHIHILDVFATFLLAKSSRRDVTGMMGMMGRVKHVTVPKRPSFRVKNMT